MADENDIVYPVIEMSQDDMERLFEEARDALENLATQGLIIPSPGEYDVIGMHDQTIEECAENTEIDVQRDPDDTSVYNVTVTQDLIHEHISVDFVMSNIEPTQEKTNRFEAVAKEVDENIE